MNQSLLRIIISCFGMARNWGNLWQCLQCVIAGVVHVNARNHLCHYRPACTGTSPQVSETIWDCWCTTTTHHSWNLLVVVAHMKNTHVDCVVNKSQFIFWVTHMCAEWGCIMDIPMSLIAFSTYQEVASAKLPNKSISAATVLQV